MIVMAAEREDEFREERKKDVTIRGVDSDLYDRAAEIARRTGKTIGEIINEALGLFIDLTEGIRSGIQPLVDSAKEASRRIGEGLTSAVPTVISDLEEIEVTKTDLEQFGRRVVFQNIDRLIFTDDVDAETFDKYVALIRNCEEVKPPKGVSKLLVLSKCRRVERLIAS
ncbi:MAG: hypothetical protein QI223_03390 [Candidatus Korarchaeota archaeon]|nr:hypothetical protein [Candidatus Korarchaeota archaeon]